MRTMAQCLDLYPCEDEFHAVATGSDDAVKRLTELTTSLAGKPLFYRVEESDRWILSLESSGSDRAGRGEDRARAGLRGGHAGVQFRVPAPGTPSRMRCRF
jgi:hypothetical protein